MLFNILLTLNICSFLFFIIYLTDTTNCIISVLTDKQDTFANKKRYITHSDRIDLLRSKYYILKGNKNEKSLYGKNKLLNNYLNNNNINYINQIINDKEN